MKKNNGTYFPLRPTRGFRLDAGRTAALILTALCLSTAHSLAAAEDEAAQAYIMVQDGEGNEYRVPPAPGTHYQPKAEGIFLCADEPFRGSFTRAKAFVAARLTAPGALYFFSHYAYPNYGVIGDGSYLSPADMFKDMSPEEKARFKEQYKDLRDGIRYTTDPNEILDCLRRIAERCWNSPDIMDFNKNGGDQYRSFLKDAVITTTRASLPAIDDAALATRIEFHIESEQLLMGQRAKDLSENALYFVLGPKVVKLGMLDMSKQREEVVFANLDTWRKAIIQANPDLKRDN